MAAKKKSSGNSKPLTAKELKHWLQGILEFQKNDWNPDKVQWETIKEKIFNLQEGSSEIVRPINNSVQHTPDNQMLTSQLNQNVVPLTREGGSGNSLLSDGSFPQLSALDIENKIAAAKSGLSPGGSVVLPISDTSSFE